jgi:predicted alpha/beta hydrolase family esterase
MLARLLRFTIALQMLMGAALGFWLALYIAPSWTTLGMLVTGFALPFVGTVLADGVTCSVSRGTEPASAWWRALWGEMGASVLVFLLRQPWVFAPPPILAADGGASGLSRVPVLLVHGYVCNARLWDDMVPALRSQGHTVLAVHLEPVFTSIDDYAPLLEQAVHRLRQHTGQDKVALVGHSMGGLAIRAWLRRYGNGHAARIITLGTPHVGTQINVVLATPNARQMAWHSAWLQELAASESAATRSLFHIALSAQDNIVFPQRAQTLQGVTPMVFEGLGHLQLCTSATVRHWVCQQLALR